MTSARLDYSDTQEAFHALDLLAEDQELMFAAQQCMERQREIGGRALRTSFQPHPDPEGEVSPEALQAVIRAGAERSDIATTKDMSNALVFNGFDDPALDKEVAELRRRVDALFEDRVSRLFSGDLWVANSGHFWYPPGGYMGWHNNLETPGWRLYISYAVEPGKSFFRYRDPNTHAIATEMDKVWNLRLFRVTSDRPLWHAIYSQTDRFSIGYNIRLPSMKPRLPRVKRLVRRATRGLKRLARARPERSG